jgi:hypothetical protein
VVKTITSKQDRPRARTAADIEQKYNFGKTFAEVFNLITDAQKAADEAKAAIDNLDHEQIFNLLTDNGRIQGVYRGDDGDVYINASYIKSGKIAAEFIDATNLTITDSAIVGGAIRGAEIYGGIFSDLEADNYMKVFSSDDPNIPMFSSMMAHYVGDADSSTPLTTMGWMYADGESMWYLAVLGSIILSRSTSGVFSGLVRAHGVWDFSGATVIGLPIGV